MDSPISWDGERIAEETFSAIRAAPAKMKLQGFAVAGRKGLSAMIQLPSSSFLEPAEWGR
jgi:hypothetical protein